MDRGELPAGTPWFLSLPYERLDSVRAIPPLVSAFMNINPPVLIHPSLVAQGSSQIDGKWSYETLIVLQFLFIGKSQSELGPSIR